MADTQVLNELKALGDDLRARLADLDRRLQALEGEGGAGAPASPEPKDAVPEGPSRTVTVTISPLHDVSRVRVVEDALTAIDGVRSATLRQLQGDAAQIEVAAGENVPLISGLRKTLQVAFDVSESDDSRVTIALAQPRAESEGGVAAPSAS